MSGGVLVLSRPIACLRRASALHHLSCDATLMDPPPLDSAPV